MTSCLHSWHYLGKRSYRCRLCGKSRVMDPPMEAPEYLTAAAKKAKTVRAMIEAVREANRANAGDTKVDCMWVEGRWWYRQPDGLFEPAFYETELIKSLKQHYREKGINAP